MRILWIAVTFVAACASATPRDREWAKIYPNRSMAPRDSIERERTGQSLNRTPDSMTRTDQPVAPQPVGPMREIPPTPPILP